MTDPKFVAFSTQKGGAGKTTLTVLAASYLYYVKGLKQWFGKKIAKRSGQRVHKEYVCF